MDGFGTTFKTPKCTNFDISNMKIGTWVFLELGHVT